MSDQQKEYKPLKVWVEGSKKPLEYKSSLDALKDVKNIRNATSASIDVIERIGTEGSTISSKESAGLRNWAIKELEAVSKANKSLNFMDVKYLPADKVKKDGKEIDILPRLVFRMSQSRNGE